MNRLKKLLPGLLCALVICILLPFRAEAASGSCGTNATWSLNTSTGVLTISGTGAMNDYTYSTRFWADPQYKDTITKIVVSEGITYIGNNAFNSCAATSVSLPSTLKSMGANAFYQCKATSLTIPAGVTTIGEDALDSMSNLTAINVAEGNTSYSSHSGVLYKGTTLLLCPQNTALTAYTVKDGTTRIERSAFWGCKNLTAVTIPASVTAVGQGAFYGCTNLTSATVNYLGYTILDDTGMSIFSNTASGFTIRAYDAGSYRVNNPSAEGSWQAYATKWGHKYQSLGHAGGNLKNGTWLIKNGVLTVSADGPVTERPWSGSYPSYAGYIDQVVVQSGVTALPEQAFSDSWNLKKVTMADTVETIGIRTFYNCDDLTAVTLSKNLTAIPDDTFYGCGALTAVTIPDKVTSIGARAFEYCRKLQSVTLPDSVKTVGEFAFAACPAMTAIDLGSVESLGDYAINDCDGLTQVTLPATLTDLGECNFIGCDKLTAITVEGGSPVFSSNDGILYSKDGKTLVCYPDGKEGTEFTLPETVTAIARDAFYSNSNLTSLTLHSGIVSVGEEATVLASKLTDVYYDGTAENWAAVELGEDAFDDDVTIHFGLDCKNAGTRLVGYAEATCTAAGYTGDTVCTGCGAVVKKGTTVAKKSHSLVSHAAQTATCTQIGWNSYYTCKNCDYTTYVEKPMTAHKQSYLIKEATCTQDGYKGPYCSNCKQFFTDNTYTAVGEPTPIPAKGHSWGDWQTVTAATWLEAGEERRSCTACSETETNTLPATGQTVVDGITVTVTEGSLTLENVPQGLTVIFGVYSGGKQVSVQLGTVFTLPEGADSAMLFFADSAFRPIGTAKPVIW